MLSNRMILAGAGCAFVFLLILLSSSFENTSLVPKLHGWIGNGSSSGSITAQTTAQTISSLFQSVKSPISADTYKDASGREFSIAEGGPYWHEPLGDKVLIVDIDTRVPDGPNGILNKERMEWEALKLGRKGSAASASFMNHFLYAQVHGYDYRFFQAADMQDMHNTWIKPHALRKFLDSYQFVVFIDADATVQHLELPLEWLFNRWGITPSTSIAMPIDTTEDYKGDKLHSMDSKGKVVLNSGFVVAQALPFTFEMMDAWTECPTEKRYKGCANWKNKWSHEQRAFSEYIRYDFNPDGNNIVEISCDDAMGYPGLVDVPRLTSNCTGQFLRHHTLDKAMTKESVELGMLQALTDVLHKELWRGKQEYWIVEA